MVLYDYAMQYVPQKFRWQEEAEYGRSMAVPRGKVPTYAPAPIGSDTTTSRHLLSFLDFVTCQYVNSHATHSFICMCLYPDLVPQRPPRREDCRAHQVFSTFASHEATTLWQNRVQCERSTTSYGKPPPNEKVRPPSSMSA